MTQRNEPASMTMGDVLVLVAGVAASVAFIGGPLVNPVVRMPAVELVGAVLRFLRGTSLAVSLVALARVGLYRRMPSAPEWLAILVGCSLLVEWPWLDVDHWIYENLRPLLISPDRAEFIGARWFVAGLYSAVIAIGLGLLRLGRRLFPTWLKTIFLAWLALLAMSGPLWVLSLHGADLISPSEGFGPEIFSILYRGACDLLASLPMGLLFGVPAVAALRERIAGRGWTWVEWAGAAISTLCLLAILITARVDLSATTTEWLPMRLLTLAWIAAIAFISYLILDRIAGPWNRWVQGPTNPDQSLPDSDSEASTL